MLFPVLDHTKAEWVDAEETKKIMLGRLDKFSTALGLSKELQTKLEEVQKGINDFERTRIPIETMSAEQRENARTEFNKFQDGFRQLMNDQARWKTVMDNNVLHLNARIAEERARQKGIRDAIQAALDKLKVEIEKDNITIVYAINASFFRLKEPDILPPENLSKFIMAQINDIFEEERRVVDFYLVDPRRVAKFRALQETGEVEIRREEEEAQKRRIRESEEARRMLHEEEIRRLKEFERLRLEVEERERAQRETTERQREVEEREQKAAAEARRVLEEEAAERTRALSKESMRKAEREIEESKAAARLQRERERAEELEVRRRDAENMAREKAEREAEALRLREEGERRAKEEEERYLHEMGRETELDRLEAEIERTRAAERQRRIEEEKQRMDAARAMMQSEWTIRIQNGFHVTTDLFFHTVMIPYLYWLWGVHEITKLAVERDNLKELVAGSKRIRHYLYVRSIIYSYMYTQAPSRMGSDKTKQMLMEALRIDQNLMVKTEGESIAQFNFPLAAMRQNALVNLITLYQTEYQFEQNIDRLILLGKTFSREEIVIGTAALAPVSYNNYFRYFWVPQSGWDHDYKLGTPHVHKYIIPGTTHYEPLWKNFYEIPFANYKLYMDEIFNNTIYIPFSYLVVSDMWSKRNIFTELGREIAATFRKEGVLERFGLESQMNIFDLKVIFATHVCMVSQIAIFWSMGMKLINVVTDETKVNLISLMDFQVFVNTTKRATSQSEYYFSEGAFGRFLTENNLIGTPSRIAMKQFMNEDGMNVPIINPITRAIVAIGDEKSVEFYADSKHIGIMDAQNSIFFETTLAAMEGMPLFDDAMLKLIESCEATESPSFLS